MLARLKAFFNPPTDADPLRAPARIFWTALIVRLVYMTLAHTYKFRVIDDHFQFGWEAGRIARALVTGYGYADPFSNVYVGHTGPTAWLPPVYPVLIAAVFKLFGVYTRMSAWVLLTINCVLSAATATMAWEIAARMFSRRNALWSAWLWALYPAAMQYAVRWVWEMTLTTFLFTGTILLALRMAGVGENAEGERTREPLTARWLLFGFLWGLIALTNTSLLGLLPFAGVWILVKTWKQPRALAGAILGGVIFVATVTPWEIRDYRVFHAFIPIRGNLGVETYLGNGPGSTGWLMAYDHPFLDPAQVRNYRALGELKYARVRGELAKKYIHSDPGHFAYITALRTYFFWAGVPHPSDEAWYNEIGRTLNFDFISIAGLLGLALAVYRRVPGSMLFLFAFLTLPVPYYIVTVHARFRHPLEPLIAILGVYLFQSATRSPRVDVGS